MTQGGQVLVSDEILGNIYVFFPCIFWIIAFSILQEYVKRSCFIMNNFPYVVCEFVSGAGTALVTAEGCSCQSGRQH